MSEHRQKPGISSTPPGGGGPRLALFRAGAILDAAGMAGTALLVELGAGDLPRVLAVGSPDEVATHPGSAAAQAFDLRHCVIIPGLVNAHVHLDLTHIGPQPHEPGDGFLPWIDMIRSSRRHDAAGIAESVQKGIEMSLKGGAVAVGDIAGGLPEEAGLAAWRTLAESPLLGVCFTEVFGIGNRRQAGMDRLQAIAPDVAHAAAGPVRLGIQPHAPYSVDRRVYAEAVRFAHQTGAPLATHLAESPEEDLLVRHAEGPFRHLLERLGFWDESVEKFLGRGEHPAQHLEPILREAPFLVAHMNDATDEAIDLLARHRATIAYCPRGAEYFGRPAAFGPHRYREMLQAGVNVALGTDSLVNLPAGTERLSVLDEARLLYRRDRTDPLLLLRMATVNGANGLGMPEDWFRFRPGGELAGAVAVPLEPHEGDLFGSTWNTPVRDGLTRVLDGSGSPVLLFNRKDCCWSRGPVAITLR
jgi:aminodeoxyfutalosine deaminase